MVNAYNNIEKFINSPIRSLQDHEILQIALSKTASKKDLSRILLEKFGSISAIISADVSTLLSVHGINQKVILHLKILQDLFSRVLIPIQKETIHVLKNETAVLNYCKFLIGFKRKEYFYSLFVNTKNILIGYEICGYGTVNQIYIFPREIAKDALLHNAYAVILVHNHPSGDSAPSPEDIIMTQKIHSALKTIDVILHDHIIIAKHKHFSFKHHNLITN